MRRRRTSKAWPCLARYSTRAPSCSAFPERRRLQQRQLRHHQPHRSSINFGEGSTLTFTITDGATWTLSSSIGNTFSQSSGTGSGTFTVTYGAGNNTGTDTVTLHAIGPSSSDTGTVSIKVN